MNNVPHLAKVKNKSRSPVKIHRIINKTDPKTGTSLSPIYLLPDTALESIFCHLSYEELIPTRITCKWFYYVIGKMLNTKFLSLSDMVDSELKWVKLNTNHDISSNIRILHIVKSEIKILEAHCQEYVKSGVFFFYGGLIFDFIDTIVLTRNQDEATQLVAGLFVLVGDFLNNFDAVAEPQLVNKSMHEGLSWFGRKLIDCLDCYTNFEFDVNVSLTQKSHCKIFGSYNAKNVASVAPPPVLVDKNVASGDDLNALISYVRRHVRWNNLLNYIDVIDGKFESFDIICLPEIDNSNIIYSRKVKRTNHHEDSNTIKVTVDMNCHQTLTPLMCRDQLVSFKRSTSDESNHHRPKMADYRLDFTLEVFLNTKSAKNCQVITVQVCQRQGVCSIASHVDNYSKSS